jgi:hypothetical protein
MGYPGTSFLRNDPYGRRKQVFSTTVTKGPDKSFLAAENLKSEYQSALDAAKTANESRYQDILGGYETRYSEALAGLEGQGVQAGKDIGTTFDRVRAKNAQALVQSGLYSTTVAPAANIQAGVQETDARARLSERLSREKLGYQTGLSKEKLDFMERRTDTGPSESLYVNLLDRLSNE